MGNMYDPAMQRPLSGCPGTMPAISDMSLTDLVGFKKHSDGTLEVTMPHYGGIAGVIERANRDAKLLGISEACDTITKGQLMGRLHENGVAATEGMTYLIKLHTDTGNRSLESQHSELKTDGRAPAPLEALYLAAMCVHLSSAGTESLNNDGKFFVRGAASGAAIWSMGGSVCIERRANGADPSTIVASIPETTPVK